MLKNLKTLPLYFHETTHPWHWHILLKNSNYLYLLIACGTCLFNLNNTFYLYEKHRGTQFMPSIAYNFFSDWIQCIILCHWWPGLFLEPHSVPAPYHVNSIKRKKWRFRTNYDLLIFYIEIYLFGKYATGVKYAEIRVCFCPIQSKVSAIFKWNLMFDRIKIRNNLFW